MKPKQIIAAAALCGPLVSLAQTATPPPLVPSSAAIDADVWSVISTTVITSDIVGMGKTYHPDAVVVTPTRTQPVRTMLSIWGKGMEDMKQNGSKATVAFRFAKRQDDAATAFEAGIFNYVVTDKTGKVNSLYIPFEALLVLQDGKWRTVMERQLAAVTIEDWNKLAH